MRVGIVGASGVLGAYLTESLVLGGHAVTPFSRRAHGQAQAVDVLHDDPSPLLPGLDAVIYCAWATQDRSSSAQGEHVAAAARWAEKCRAGDVRFLFTSTVLASVDSASLYGRHKYLAEQGVVTEHGVALRIGLVADDALPLLLTSIRRACGRIGSLARLLDWPIYPVSSRAVAAATMEALEGGVGGVCWLAPHEPVALAEVAMWRRKAPRPSQIGDRFVRGVARIPFRQGPIGKQIDGLAGLVAEVHPEEVSQFQVSELILPDGWKECLKP